MLFFFSTTTTTTRRTVHKNIFEKLYGQIMNKTFSIDFLYNYECGPTLRRYIFTCVHSIFAIIILFFFSLERCNSFFSRSSFLFSVSRFKLSDMYVELLLRCMPAGYTCFSTLLSKIQAVVFSYY